jgi:hypothetical protein
MDDYRKVEIEIAKRHNVSAVGSRKSIGDFLFDNKINMPVNVKSNDLNKNNYSPNIISAKRLIKWLEDEDNELFFIFVDYIKTKDGIEIIDDSGLIPVQHISWDCLTIEAQGWGVIQMPKTLVIDKTQDKKAFLKGMRIAYETYMDKETKKMSKIKEMIKDF